MIPAEIREPAARPAPDDACWDQFFDRFGVLVKRAIRRGLREARYRPVLGDLEDVRQEVYLRLLERGLSQFRGTRRSHLYHFVKRLAIHVAMDRSRTRVAAKRRPTRRRPGPPPAELPDPHYLDPETQLQRRQQLRLFWHHCRRQCTGTRGLRDLRILQLAWLEGYSSREISRRFGGRLQPSGVDTVVHRLRRRLAQRGYHLPHRR